MKSPASSTRNAFSSPPKEETVEVRFSGVLLCVMTLALVFGGLVTCALLWLLSRSQPPNQMQTLRVVGTSVLLLDIGMAIFLRKFLGDSFVRADEKGVSSRSGFGKEQFAPWEKIARIETQKRGNSVSGLTLFDANGKEILRAHSNSKPPFDKAKIVAFIERRLSARR